MKKIITLLLLSGFFVIDNAFAGQLTIIYTGQTHAALFPCHCPAEPAGGISRRATKIKELRKEVPDLLLLEAGNSFAGTVRDSNKQTEELDKQRTLVYFKSLKMMSYDAVAIDKISLLYGADFLGEISKQTSLEFIGFNNPTFKSYIIKEINGLKVAVIGFEGYGQFGLDKARLDEFKKLVNKLKKENINFVIVLADLSPEDGFSISKEVEGIDCIISTATRGNDQKEVIGIGNALFAFSYWQARRLSRLNLDVQDGKIKSYSYEEIKLTPDVPDDPEVSALLAKYPEFKK